MAWECAEKLKASVGVADQSAGASLRANLGARLAWVSAENFARQVGCWRSWHDADRLSGKQASALPRLADKRRS